MSDLPLFETLADLEIKVLKEKLIEKNKRIAELENVMSQIFVMTNCHEGSVRTLYENSVGIPILQAKQLGGASR